MITKIKNSINGEHGGARNRRSKDRVVRANLCKSTTKKGGFK